MAPGAALSVGPGTERLASMITSFVSNVRLKWHGNGSKVTRVLLHRALFSFPRE